MTFIWANTVRGFIASAIAVLALYPAQNALALASDDKTLFEGAKLCTSYLPRHERQYGIPVHLLAAIASTESGRYNKELGLNLPWPWTINVEGKGYFFDTKEEAIAKVRELQARGFQSIDVGCMQVNLHHHPNAFANLEQAFDPAYNIAYAAQFLKQNFKEEGSWRKAAADYHSRTPYFGEQYARLVFSSWSRIINKVADAQAGRITPPKMELTKAEPVNLASDWSHNKKPYRHSYHALHMHSISVGHETTRENGVLVVRPEHDVAVNNASAPHEDFVINKVKYVQNRDGFEPEKHSLNQVVRPGDDKKEAAKGQFNSGIIRMGDSSAEKPAAKDNSVFVFDN